MKRYKDGTSANPGVQVQYNNNIVGVSPTGVPDAPLATVKTLCTGHVPKTYNGARERRVRKSVTARAGDVIGEGGG